MTQALIIVHSEKQSGNTDFIRTPAGSTLEWLRLRKISFQIVETQNIKEWEPRVQPKAVIICGGPMNVDEEHLHEWLAIEKKFIQRHLQQKTALLGLCLGAQLLAESLGAKVEKHKHWEVGWHPIQLQQNAIWYPETQSEIRAFQYHGYRFYLPKGAVRIASNSICEDQGFCFDQHVVGFQFHPESTEQWILDCIKADEDYPEGPFVQSKQQVAEQIKNQAKLQEWYFGFLDHWLIPQLQR